MDDSLNTSFNTSYGGPENGSSEITTSKEDVFPNQHSTFSSQIANSGHISNTLLSSGASSDTLQALNPNQLTANAQANIPPLMSIHHTNVTALPTDTTPNLLPANNPNPPVSLPQVSLPQVSLPPVQAALQGTNTMAGVANLPLIPMPVVTTTGVGSSTNVVSLGKPKVSHGKVMDGISPHLFAASEGDTENDNGGFQKKVPILRLKKKHMNLGSHDDNATFERQEISKNDSYCWVCHDGGDVLCCDKCPRVFHIQCSGLPKAPEGDEEWFCPVCKNIARKTKRSRPTDLKELLLLAVSRMMFPGTEIFQSPVPADIMVHYREYVFHPLDLGTIRKKVMSGVYQSTRQFTHDTEWILHNCIIYNGKHALSKIAKGIIKVCKEDMREIELCPGCYKLTVKQPKDWFCVPCNPPHPVVLAKIRGYPLWPAKLISETSDKCDVRFFGQHDRSLVPRSCISELVGLPPKPSTKTQHWNIAMFELKRYGENIEDMRSQLSGGKLPGKTIRVSKQHDLKTLTPDHNHLGNSISNHLSASPAVVEVSPSGLHSNSSDRSNLATFSEPSSPDTPPGLQIDLEDSTLLGGKHRQSPSKILGMLSAIERNSQVPGSLDFGGDTGPQTVTLPSPTAGISKIKRGNKGRKAGDMLSQLVSSLAERQRMGVVTPGSSPVVLTSGGVVASFDNLEPDQSLREEMDDSGTPTTAVADINPAFSSIYADRNKTAVYEVDPSGKRDRKRKKPGNDSTPPQAKKPARTAKVSPNKAVSLNDLLTDSPQIHVATSEVVKLGRMTAADRVPSSVSPQPQTIVPGISGHVTTASHAAGSSIIVGPKTPSKSNRGANPAKKRSRPKGSKGSKTSLAGRTSTTHTPSIASSPSVISHEQNTAIIKSTTMVKPTASMAADVRVEEAAQKMGAVANEIDIFQEGTGLLADTLRKVNSSFHARLNQMSGGSEDMGYQYFMEKLMSSVKTVLIEMLSSFDAKSRLSAKQLKDQLHTCWPVPNSRVVLDQLRKELRDEMKQSLEVVRASAALELEQVINEVKRQVEKEKEIAVIETKKKKWCTYCMNEAQYNCCWNANYCNEVCQQAHWPEHLKECTQIQQVPRTPGLSPSELPLPVPPSKPSTPQITTTGHSMSSGGNSMANQEATQQASQHQQQGAYMFVNSSAAAMAAAVQAHAQAQRQGQSMIAGMAGGSPALPQQALSSVPGNVGGPHSMHISSSQHGGHTSHSHTSHAHSSTPMVEAMGQQHGMDHGGTPSENTASRMEHLPSENILNTTAAASPPNHIRSLFLSQNQQQAQQQQQQQARMNTESPVLSLVGAHQGGPSTPSSQMHHGVASTPIGMTDNSSLSSVSHHSQHQNSDHSHSSNSSILLHAQSPISPAIPHSSETQSTVHNYWPSYQPQLLIGNENYRHLLPAMQVNTSTGQNQTFFRAAY